MGSLTRNNQTRAISFSDGLLIPGEGVRVAALHLPTCKLPPPNLGNPTSHTVYEAEWVGIHMAADLAFSHCTRLQTIFWFFRDNELSIRVLTQPLIASPGLGLRKKVISSFFKLISLSPTTSFTLAWFPVHVGVYKNKVVDQAAKAATNTGTPQHRPTSLVAVKQQINTKCKASVIKPPPPHIFRRLHGVHDPAHIKKALTTLP